MDILTILFLIFGWIFRKKGLVITAIVLASIITLWGVYILFSESSKPKETSRNQYTFLFDCILLGLSIIKLCIW